MSSEVTDRGRPAPPPPESSALSHCRRMASEVMQQWRQGAGELDAQALLAKHPQLRDFKSVVLDLAYEEYCLRVARGEDLGASQFCQRFPSYQKSLKQQIELFWLLERSPNLLDQCITVPWPEPGEELLGYRIIGELGQGAFARVYLASEEALGRRLVAIKVCLFGADEADILGKLQHRNIVSVHSVRQQEGSALTVLCMPYLGRATLCDVLDLAGGAEQRPTKAEVILEAIERANRESLPVAQREPVPKALRSGTYVDGILHLAVQLAEALQYAHGQGILHLDLKPSNVLLSNSGTPMLLDFNLAQDREKRRQPTGGTLPYMSPEQLRCFIGQADGTTADARSDVFSFGVILYELLFGQLPFGPIPDELAPKQLARELLERQTAFRVQRGGTAARQLSDSLVQLVAKCLALDPQDRFQSADQLLLALRRETSLVRSFYRWVHSHPLAAGTTAALLLLVGSLLGTYLATRDPYSVRQLAKAREAYKEGAFEESLQLFDSAIEADARSASAYYGRALAQIQKEKYELAIRDLEKAFAISQDPAYLGSLAYCCNLMRVHENAITYYQRAIRSGARSAALYNNLGYSHLRRNRSPEAYEAYTAALQFDPDLQPALHSRAMLDLADSRKNSRLPLVAMQDIQHAVSSEGHTAVTVRDAAQIYAYASSIDERYEAEALMYTHQALELGISPKDLLIYPELQKLFASYPELNTIQAGADTNVAARPTFLINLIEEADRQ